jgi:hypothetical protein
MDSLFVLSVASMEEIGYGGRLLDALLAGALGTGLEDGDIVPYTYSTTNVNSKVGVPASVSSYNSILRLCLPRLYDNHKGLNRRLLRSLGRASFTYEVSGRC